MTGDGLILVVEDSEEDTEAIQRALSRSRPLVDLEFAPRSEAVIPRLLDPAARTPDLLLLDLNMPGMDGLTLLSQLRAHTACASLTVVVFTSSTASAEEDACYAAGADSYIYKPVNFELFRTVLQGAVDFWLPREADGAVTAGPTAAPPA
ncbi:MULTISPECIES: response regulator [Streptomyces]|uniref:Response regulator n=3 Tax=Streptomyces TaxID=1883 RepID=A0A927BJN5_STRGL|nr:MULTISPECIES: response regulator [Streptomyces]MBD2828072.1 response regulator [Streptomyces globisporus]MYW80445.1 response regulator [Streptomyces sp. SID8369]NEA08613.1 response regulator [Streptomyces sp. SID10692]NEC45526.1 response regulator [Streptomyces sp. SID8016]ARF62488.1 response regulator [Streptomyces violaceoruber]